MTVALSVLQRLCEYSILNVIHSFLVLSLCDEFIIKPQPPVGAGGGHMFLGRPSVRPSMHP